MRAWLLVVLLAGCSSPAAETAQAPGPDEPIAPAEPAPIEVFSDRITATGIADEASATFTVPENHTRLSLRTDADAVAVGRFQLQLENPAGKSWLVYGGYGIRSPVNSMTAGSGDWTVDAAAMAGTWTLHTNTDGHVDLGVTVSVSP